MAESPPLRHGPVVPQLEALMRDRIRQGRWQAGDRLPSEVRLAEELGVGRSSVREAVRLLARDGLLDVRHGSGTFVTVPEEVQSLPEPDEVGGLLRRARLIEAFEVRRALEVEAARLAASRIRPEDIAELRARLRARQERLGDEPEPFVEADLEFHRAIMELSGNAVLAGLFALVEPGLRVTLVEMFVHERGLPDVSDAHADLLGALERGDAQAAIAATVEHLDAILTFISAKAAEQ
ncbi:FadR family transcriptional regulator [Nonomuraea sp. NBC_01738]|uniref:FadR/GntR family transcriptional regulator n=1 Tax=Nonomuraea sp. NBC_01738 TaxID=2976003 RepID=UPI002E10796B|nr:FadR family transcriptional regulator [Nonomuraea sp. NBC_01738]